MLIVGCGDIGLRVAQLLLPRYRVYALVRTAVRAQQLRTVGIIPVLGDLDQPRSLNRIAGLATTVVHCAPPPATGSGDPRTARLLTALAHPRQSDIVALHLIYISTSGVYGDCGGRWVSETTPPRPESARAQRRIAAEHLLRRASRRRQIRCTILRAPGIHGPQRLPLERIHGGQPVLCDADSGWGNHIDADDLARAVVALLHDRHNSRVYNVVDNQPLPHGQYLQRIAMHLSLPPLPALPREQAEQQMSASLWSFQRESRRIDNHRLCRESRWRPLRPDLASVLRDHADP